MHLHQQTANIMNEGALTELETDLRDGPEFDSEPKQTENRAFYILYFRPFDPRAWAYPEYKGRTGRIRHHIRSI